MGAAMRAPGGLEAPRAEPVVPERMRVGAWQSRTRLPRARWCRTAVAGAGVAAASLAGVLVSMGTAWTLAGMMPTGVAFAVVGLAWALVAAIVGLLWSHSTDVVEVRPAAEPGEAVHLPCGRGCRRR